VRLPAVVLVRLQLMLLAGAVPGTRVALQLAPNPSSTVTSPSGELLCPFTVTCTE
jgi:hypothetical protein